MKLTGAMDARARAKLLSRYRFLFKATVATFGGSVVFIGLGVLTMLFAAEPRILGAGLLAASLSGLLAYKMVLSTMKLIEASGDEFGWRDA
jgi:hypothetical protein